MGGRQVTMQRRQQKTVALCIMAAWLLAGGLCLGWFVADDLRQWTHRWHLRRRLGPFYSGCLDSLLAHLDHDAPTHSGGEW